MKDSSFWGDWEHEKLSDGHYKITFPIADIAMIIPTGKLLIKTGWAFQKGDIIKIGNIEVEIIKVEHIFWGLTNSPDYDPKAGYNLALTVKSDQMDKLEGLINERL